MMWKRLLCALLAAILATGAVAGLAETAGEALENQLTLEDIRALGGAADIQTDDAGNVVFIDGSCAQGPVTGMADAARLVASMTALLGGDARTRFEPWRTLTDARGNRYYVFQQMYAHTTVSGGAVKIVTDAEGNMLGLISSVETELPDAEESQGITAAQAEQVVEARAAEVWQAELNPIGEGTEKIILPVNLKIDVESEEEKEESRFVWVVYTENPTARIGKSSDLPYLAHYVTMDGEYLYSLPTILPGDEASVSGFDAGYVFEFMEPAEYRGLVTLSTGEEVEIDVTVMRDTRTGMYYLGNIERRIVVADCYHFLYDDGRVVLEYSPDNRQWDAVGLLSLYNYCRAWDYYNAIGWQGGDGEQTPIIVLNDFCGSNHDPVDNACYVGKYMGWQIFAASLQNDFSQCLDVIAHEFTHCVTGSVMTYNAYQNDYGAINEAMSDIQGNICEMLLGATDDTTWELGETGEEPVRSMSDPHRYDQPEYSWDLYYMPNVKIPADLNDRGGVHTNSSLLNNVAYRLCEKGGMTLEEARLYWFAVDCAMVPGTNYARLSRLLPWVMKLMGMEQHLPALEAAIDATRLGRDAMPETLDADRAMVTLTLPDNEVFSDGNWGLQIFCVDVDALKERIADLQARIENGDTEGIPVLAQELLGSDGEFGKGGDATGIETAIGDVLNMLFGDEEEAPEAGDESEDESDEEFTEFLVWAVNEIKGVFYQSMGAAGQDGHTVRIMSRPGLTIPILIHLSVDPMTMQMKNVGAAVYVNNRWYDLTGLIELIPMLDEEEEIDEDLLLGLLMEDGVVMQLVADLMPRLLFAGGIEGIVKVLTWRIEGGKVCEISDKGLDKVKLPEQSTWDDFSLSTADPDKPRQMSRPVEEEPAA